MSRRSLSVLGVVAVAVALFAGCRQAGVAQGGVVVSSESGGTSPEVACRVTGVWDLVGLTRDGTPVRLGGQQRKVVTAKYFMWLGQENRRDTLPLKTLTDTLRKYRMSGGTGRYTLAGNTYTEHLEYFVDPSLIGTDWKATCRTEGDRWIHTFTFPDSSGGPERVRQVTYVEDWRRVE